MSMIHVPPERILVATDFSEIANGAIDWAIAFARRLGAEIVLVHVWEVPLPPYPEHAPPADAFDNLERASRQVLDAAVESRSDEGVRIRGVLRSGPAWSEIVVASQAEGADLVVVGTHGHRGIARLLLGSCAERVVRTAPCPVVVVGPRANP